MGPPGRPRTAIGSPRRPLRAARTQGREGGAALRAVDCRVTLEASSAQSAGPAAVRVQADVGQRLRPRRERAAGAARNGARRNRVARSAAAPTSSATSGSSSRTVNSEDLVTTVHLVGSELQARGFGRSFSRPSSVSRPPATPSTCLRLQARRLLALRPDRRTRARQREGARAEGEARGGAADRARPVALARALRRAGLATRRAARGCRRPTRPTSPTTTRSGEALTTTSTCSRCWCSRARRRGSPGRRS